LTAVRSHLHRTGGFASISPLSRDVGSVKLGRALDPEDGLALQLAEAGERRPAEIVETVSGSRIAASPRRWLRVDRWPRRFEAAQRLGWYEIAAVVRDETDDQAYILTLVQNLQREDLNPREEAAALEVLVRERAAGRRARSARRSSAARCTSVDDFEYSTIRSLDRSCCTPAGG
jgi:hypothetical protein